MNSRNKDPEWDRFTESVKPSGGRSKRESRIRGNSQAQRSGRGGAKEKAQVKSEGTSVPLADAHVLWPASALSSDAVPVKVLRAIEDSDTPRFTRAMERKLRCGDIAIDARLDLHGMTQEQAYAALGRFVGEQIRTRGRTLLIITGKGRNMDGVLRSSLPQWLRTFPHAQNILSVRQSAPKHGGLGSYYVLLKGKRHG